MKYNMTVTIKDPYTEKNMNSDLIFLLEADFVHDAEQYGNGYQVAIGSRKDSAIPFYRSIVDLRYDTDFDPDKKISWLADWAEHYWSGKDGAYKLESIAIQRID